MKVNCRGGSRTAPTKNPYGEGKKLLKSRRSIRLKGYDYSLPAAYFVTICSKEKGEVFGAIKDGQMELNQIGNLIRRCWLWLPEQYDYIKLDEWIVMQDHMHGIINMLEDCRCGSRTGPTNKCTRKSLGRLIGAFKTLSTKRINRVFMTPGMMIWQRNYYKHIIRNEAKLNQIRNYIVSNPERWQFDHEDEIIQEK